MSDLFGNTPPKKHTSRDLLSLYDAEFQKHYDGRRAPIVGKKDGPLAVRLLSLYQFSDHELWMPIYFIAPIRFARDNGHSFSVYSMTITQVMAHAKLIQRQPVVTRTPFTETQLAIRAQIEAEWRGR